MSDFMGQVSNWRIVFYGQSLVQSYAVDSTTELTMRGRGVPWSTAAVGGFAWVQLVNHAARRVHSLFGKSQFSAMYMVGGTTDYADAINRTGVQCVTDQTTIAAAAKAAGCDIVVSTTTTPSTTISANEDERLAGNALLLAAAGGSEFDYVVDLAADATLTADIAANDGTHPGPIGRQRIADLLAPSLDLILDS